MQTKIIKVNPDFPEEDLIKEAAVVLKKGGLVAFPTETVYGIGANFLDPEAMERLYTIKKRDINKPFTMAIGSIDTLKYLDIELSVKAEKLIHKYWPGPLTIVMFNRNMQKIGIRMPKNKIALALIEEASLPIALPSANMSGEKPPISSEEVVSAMKGFVDIILDGGNTEIGKESTVVDITTHPVTVLREGALPKEYFLEEDNVLFVCTGNSCRSVMAKAMLEKFLNQAGLSEKVSVDSAGTSSYDGIPATENTIKVLKEEAIDVSMHKGKHVTPDLLRKSDFIFVMERSHRSSLLNMVPEVDSKLRLLKEDEDIPDPIGKSLDDYRRVKDSIKDYVENIFLELFKKGKHQ